MTHVANIELSRRLYELSHWVDTWQREPAGDTLRYSLGFILRKLPRKLNGVNSKQRDGNFNLYASRGKTAWIASYADADCSIIRRLKLGAESQNNRNFWWVQASADTPENAAVKLCIALFENGVLKRQDND